MLHILHQREKPLQSDIEKAVRSAMLISVKDYISPFQGKQLSLSLLQPFLQAVAE